MAWTRIHPLNVHSEGIPGLYCDNSSAPKPHHGIGRNRRPSMRLLKKARWLKNRAARAELNAEFKGEAGSARAAVYHSRLFALSNGTA